MNIFVLDESPQKAAEYHCNKHVVKMILESSQMLCAAHWYSLLNENNKQMSDFKGPRKAKEWLLQNANPAKIPPYTFTHVRHPCTTWTAETMGNYSWHMDLMWFLLEEYKSRYKRDHKCLEVWKWLKANSPTHINQSSHMTVHPQAMPVECKVPGDPVQAYRNYYSQHKRRFAKWEPLSKTPHWF